MTTIEGNSIITHAVKCMMCYCEFETPIGTPEVCIECASVVKLEIEQMRLERDAKNSR